MTRSRSLAGRATSFTLSNLAAALLFSTIAFAGLDLSWNTVDGGGRTFSTGGGFQLGGTIGQPDAGTPMSGGNFELRGGFWPGVLQGAPSCLGDIAPPGGNGVV